MFPGAAVIVLSEFRKGLLGKVTLDSAADDQGEFRFS